MAQGKKRGIKASAQDNFLQPDPVTGLSGTNVGTNRSFGDGAVDLSWSLPATSPAATSYTITTTPATSTVVTGNANTTYRFTGLSGGTSYTFTVVGTNAAGTANATTSGSITVTTVPQAPQSVSGSALSANTNRISWTAGATGGSALTSYTITGSDGSSYTGISSSATSYDANDPGTSPGSQTYTIVAINANGTSAGATTASVTTTPPFFPFFPPYFVPPFFPPYFVPPFFPPFFPFFPFFPPYFVPPFFPPFFPFFPFFPPYFVPPFFPPFFPFFPPFFPPAFGPFFPPYFVPPYFVPPFFGNRGCLSFQKNQFSGGCSPNVNCASGGSGSAC